MFNVTEEKQNWNWKCVLSMLCILRPRVSFRAHHSRACSARWVPIPSIRPPVPATNRRWIAGD